MVAALEMLSRSFEIGPALEIDQMRDRIGKAALGIADSLGPGGLEEQRPARPEPAQHVVGARAGRDEFTFGRALEIRPAEGEAALEATILVEHHTRRDERGPGKMIGKPIGAIAIFAQVQHRKNPFCRMWRRSTAAKAGSRRVATTATLWPTAQIRRPANHC